MHTPHFARPTTTPPSSPYTTRASQMPPHKRRPLSHPLFLFDAKGRAGLGKQLLQFLLWLLWCQATLYGAPFRKNIKHFNSYHPRTQTLLFYRHREGFAMELPMFGGSRHLQKHQPALISEMLLRVSFPGSTQSPGIWEDLPSSLRKTAVGFIFLTFPYLP